MSRGAPRADTHGVNDTPGGDGALGTADDTRPDGRASRPETLKLRAATRALRLHLERLPVDYDYRVALDRFLTGVAFMLASNRYACAESLIGASFGGTVVGALARSLLADGLRWLWIAQDPSRRTCLLGDLIEERSRIASQANVDGARLTRLLMPVPPVADLAGASHTWLDSPSVPSDDALLDELFHSPAGGSPDSSAGSSISGTDDQLQLFLDQAHQMFDLAGLRGAAMVLAHAGHGNYLGQRSTLTEDGVVGFDLRADHEALSCTPQRSAPSPF